MTPAPAPQAPRRDAATPAPPTPAGYPARAAKRLLATSTAGPATVTA